MNATSEGESFPGSVQIPGGTTVLVELTPDIHICGICKQQFNNLDAFVAHKQSGCPLTGSSGAAPSTVQFVSEETVPAAQTQATTRTITSETQTITVSAPEFVFEHGYQTYLPTESNENQTATVISLPAKSRAKKPTAPPAQKRLNCCYPGCQFKTAYGMKDMERHLKIHTGDKPHKCEVCGKCFSRKDKLKTHMRCHTGVKPYKCKTCDYAAADSSSLNKHLRIHSDERPFKCQICPYASRNSSQLTVHLRSHTASELDNDPKPTCPAVDGGDAQKIPAMALAPESKDQTVMLGERTFNCCYPGCHFKTVHGMKDLDRHLRIHTGDKPHKCEFCDKCFSRKDNLTMHMRCHTSVKPHKCHLCDYAAVDSSSLKKHLRIHSDERPYKCQLCPYASRNSSQLTVHLRSHTGDAPFQCWLCSAKFKISSDLKRHMRVHSGEKPFKCEFCNVRCTMKGNLKSHIRIKHSGNNFKCPHCDFLGDSKATLRKHSRVHQSEHPEKCSECSYSCPSKAALRVHERIHCTDRPFKCQYCSFDSKQPSNLSKHVKKFHADVVKTEALERKDSGRQSSRQVAKLDAKKTFHCDMCEASFMREDSLRSHKRQHSEYHENKNSDVTVLQFQIDPGKQPAAPLTVGHLQVPLQPSQVPPFSEGRVKIIVGHQVPQANTIIQAAAAAVNIVPPALVAQNPEELPGNSRLQILRQVNLIAPPQPSGCPSEAGAMTQPAVLLTAHDQADGATLHQTLIPATPGSPQEGSGNQTFITSSGITCTDFEGLNALIQEGTTEVTVVSDGGQNIAVATTAPPIFSSSSQQELPKQTYSIIQGGAHPALLCPADSIPD